MNDWLLGKDTSNLYAANYSPELLTAVPRQITRDELEITTSPPFKGIDIWNAWELSWLNSKGKPIVASARFQYSAASENIIESKSFKLYLNSLNQTNFKTIEEVTATLKKDLSQIVGSDVEVIIYLDNDRWPALDEPTGICIDSLDIDVTDYDLTPEYLKTATVSSSNIVTEQLYSHLFKSNCMVTGQPDWASLFISYTGKAIDHQKLLKYIVSFRNHQAFHEPCVERIFVDLMKYCRPEKLSVYCRFTRRGGLDINPFRSTIEIIPSNARIWRQ